MTKPNAVEYFGFVDRARGELFVLALKSAEYNGISLLALFNGLEIFRLLCPGLPAASIRGTRVREKHGVNGLKGVSTKNTAG